MNSTVGIKIQPAHEVEAIVNAFYAKNGSSGQAREGDLFFLAYLEQTLVGCVRFCIENGHALLRTMMIDPTIRRKRIGTELLKAFEQYLEETRVKEIYCIPYDHLIGFYGQIGFQIADENLIPSFLKQRLQQYRQKDMKVVCMKRFR